MNKFLFYLDYLQYHELIGLYVETRNLFNKIYYHLSGIIVDETKNTFVIKTLTNKLKIVPKKGLIFIFKIPSTITKTIDIFIKLNGNILISNSQNRTKNLKKLKNKGS